MMKNNIIFSQFSKINQHGINMFVTTITCNELVNETTVEYYDYKSNNGYQRKLVPSHYRKIARYLKDDPMSILPSAIIGAVNSNKIHHENGILRLTEKIRLVDGQHRREGLKFLKDKHNLDYESINEMCFPLVILEIKDNSIDRINEISTFVNINKKGRPVKTDLALELSEKIRKDNNLQFESKGDFIESISISVIKELNKNNKSVWYNKIRMAEELDGRHKPVGVNTFKRSLKPFINSYLGINKIDYMEISRNSDDYDTELKSIYNILSLAWAIVYSKWTVTFESNDYNMTKGLGIYPIHIVLAELLQKAPNSVNYRFASNINNSKLTADTWIRGGELSGYNSLQGYNQIAKMIKDSIT